MHLIQLVSEVEIPGWNCVFQQEGSGGGEWICHPPDDEIRPLAEKAWEHWTHTESCKQDAEDPGPWYFWFEAEKFIIERFEREK